MSDLENIEEQVEESEEMKQAQADFDQGKTMLEQGDPILAAGAFHNALMGYEQCGDENGVANSSAQLAAVCMKREDYDGVLANCDRAQAICEKNHDHGSIMYLQKMRVKARRNLKQFDEAVKITLAILDAYGGSNNPDGAVNTLEDLCDLYVEMGEPTRAADALRTAASIHTNFKHKTQAAKLNERADQLAGDSK